VRRTVLSGSVLSGSVLSGSVLSGLAALAVMLGCAVQAAAGTLVPGTAVAALADTGPLGVIAGAGNAISW
jgi:hypothetical protein